jgi:hypothetical protein
LIEIKIPTKEIEFKLIILENKTIPKGKSCDYYNEKKRAIIEQSIKFFGEIHQLYIESLKHCENCRFKKIAPILVKKISIQK